MYNKKRNIRECLNQLLVFDPQQNSYNVIKTKGIIVLPRRDHCATVIGKFK